MYYYDYDSFCSPTRDFKHSPLVEWPQHSFYQHNSLFSPDHTPRIKQEELGGFLSYPHHQLPRSYDALNLPQQQAHQSPYSAILLSLHTGVSISQQSRYYPTQSMQEHQQRRFPPRQQQQQQQPAYEYSGPVHVAPSLLSPLVDQLGCDPHFVSVPQDSMDVPLSHALEGWDDDRPSSLSSLVESEMNEMTAMIGIGNLVEDTIGDEDAEGEDEWVEEVPSQPYGSHKRRFQSASSPTSDEWEEDPQPSGSKRRRSQPASSSVASSPIPIPVPNLTKKSRGRRVPTMSSLEDIRSAASGAGKKRQSIGGKTARMYLCEVKGCGKCFARGEHLKRHVRSIHTYEKPHRCPYPGCGKDFSRHDNLVQHLRVHKDYVPLRSPSSPPLSAS